MRQDMHATAFSAKTRPFASCGSVHRCFCQRETEKKLHQSKRLTKSALEGFRGRVSHKTSLILLNF